MFIDYINDKDIKYASLILIHEEDVDVILADFKMYLASVINWDRF